MVNSGTIEVIKHMCGHSSFKIPICVGFLFQREIQNKSKQKCGQSMYKGCSSTVNEQRDFCNPSRKGQGQKVE